MTTGAAVDGATADGSRPDWAALPSALLERAVRRARGGATRDADAEVARADARLDRAVEDDGPFQTVVETAELDRTEARVLALAAAVDLDRRLQARVHELTGAGAPVRLDVQLVADLLGPAAVTALADDGRLRRACLLEVESGVPLAAARVHLPRRVGWALLGEVALDPDLPPGTEYVVDEDAAVGVARLVLVHGEDPVRRIEAATTATYGLAFVHAPQPVDDDGWAALVRQATLVGAGLLLETEATSPLTARWLERADHLAVALLSPRPLRLDHLPATDLLEVAAPTAEVTDAEWAAAFPADPLPARRPTAEQLRLARLAATGGLTAPDAVRRVVTGTLLQHATRVVPQATWDDLVLPAGQRRQLDALVARYRQRDRVHEEWGLSLRPSPGVVALFSGPSGTGKTTSAEVIAGELGVEMFRVDLSALVSKYIGETEKNLEEIFSAAHSGGYLLLFDEADALFGSRSKVSEAKDRYANLEVSYLLQRLETYDGFVVLTSNFQGNIDPAFMRRIHAAVHFPVPGPADRERIWDRALARAPRDGLDLGFVAAQFDLTGGSIRNAALTAAFAAAEAGTGVDMPILLRAVATELTKLSRRPQDSQFGRWLSEIGER